MHLMLQMCRARTLVAKRGKDGRVCTSYHAEETVVGYLGMHMLSVHTYIRHGHFDVILEMRRCTYAWHCDSME